MEDKTNNNKIESTKSRLDALKRELAIEPILPVEPVADPEYTGGYNTTQQRYTRFVDEYMIDLNGAAAARRAGYSEHTAPQIACELLTKPYIKGLIEVRQQTVKQRLELSRDYVIQQLYKVILSCDDESSGDKVIVLKAIDIMNKMMGSYSQTITNINIDIPPIFPDID